MSNKKIKMDAVYRHSIFCCNLDGVFKKVRFFYLNHEILTALHYKPPVLPSLILVCIYMMWYT